MELLELLLCAFEKSGMSRQKVERGGVRVCDSMRLGIDAGNRSKDDESARPSVASNVNLRGPGGVIGGSRLQE